MINGTIYKITCIANRKCYIGQTFQSVEKRWQCHINGKGSKAVYNAIEKHSIDMFKFEVLHSDIPCRDVLNQLEIALIAAHDAYTQGYNEHRGGQDEYRYSKVWEHADEICRLYSDDLKSLEDIAKQFNTNKTMVQAILKAKGVDRRGVGRNKLEVWKHAQEVCDLYAIHQKTLSVIAKIYDVSPNRIAQILKEKGVKIRERGKGVSQNHSAEICRLYEKEFLSYQKIAKRFNTSGTHIRRILIECGVELRKYSPRKSKNTYQLLLDF